ncbi:MAG: hypothetical protein JOZ32_04670, partial [Bryobacterales bacterium]|nr:hypothetical protein [Bryobacterales bacterium]
GAREHGLEQFEAPPLGAAAAGLGDGFESAIDFENFKRGLAGGGIASVTQRGVADADAALADLAGQKLDDNLDLFRHQLPEKAREEIDFLEALAGVFDEARGINDAR